MEEVLTSLGIKSKEAQFYLLLLRQGRMTVLELAEATGEKRTNVYMILDVLLCKELVSVSKAGSKRQYEASPPSSLRKLLEAEHQRQQQVSAALSAVLPELKSQYALANNRPGVVYLTGLDGFKVMLDDMMRSTTEILLVASNAPTDPRIWEILIDSLARRKAQGIATRAIYHQDHRQSDAQLEQKKLEFEQRGMEVRFLGEREFKGEMAVYEDNTIFTAYEPALVTTILTSKDITDTTRILFEELWEKAGDGSVEPIV